MKLSSFSLFLRIGGTGRKAFTICFTTFGRMASPIMIVSGNFNIFDQIRVATLLALITVTEFEMNGNFDELVACFMLCLHSLAFLG